MELNDSINNAPQDVESFGLIGQKELFKQGIEAYEKGKINEAIKIFQNIISDDPGFVEAYVNLGNAYFKFEKIEEAISIWKKALGLDPHHAACYVNIGNAFYTQGNINDAIPHWHVAITIKPDHTIALLNLGAAYEKIDDHINAFKYYEQYLNYSIPNSNREYIKIYEKVRQSKRTSLNYLNEGVKVQKQNNLQKAVRYYLKSIKIYPNYPKAYLNLANVCYKADKFEHAVKYWYQTLRLDPTDASSCCNLGVAYEKLEQYENAYCAYSRYLTISKKPTITSLNVQKRMEQIKAYLVKHPELVSKQLDIAEEYYKQKKYYDALWKYENYIILKPDQLGNFEYKITELKNILDPITKTIKASFELGNKLFEEGKYDQAIESYKKCMHLDKKGVYSDTAYKKMIECGRHIGKAVRAYMKTDED